MDSKEDHVNVSLIVMEKVTSPQTTTFKVLFVEIVRTMIGELKIRLSSIKKLSIFVELSSMFGETISFPN